MDNEQQLLEELEGKDLEEYGHKIFEKIGLRCFSKLGQIKLSDIADGYAQNEHIEFDYFIPENKVLLIGEITARNETKISNKYKKFKNNINFIRNLDFSTTLWQKLGIKEDECRHFKEIELIKGFFIIPQQEKWDVNLADIEDIAIFYKSDFLRLKAYSESIGQWTKNYFLNNFFIENFSNEALTIYHQDLLKIKEIKISSKDMSTCNLYTFFVSPYKLLDIAHVYRRDELPSFQAQDTTYNYQRPLIHQKLIEIRQKLLTDQNFMFPSNILAILSKQCKYQKDNQLLFIPKKYSSISIIDGQHRLFSYADENIKNIMQNDCKIMVTAIKFLTDDEEMINKFSAKVFIEINSNQTKVEATHLDLIAYKLGNNEPKILANKIMLKLNDRSKYNSFFDITSDGQGKGIVEAVTIIDTIKKITNLKTIQSLKNPRTDKNKNKKMDMKIY